MNRRELLAGALALAAVPAAAEPEWAEGPMTLGDLRDLTQGYLDQGVDPATLVTTYVDGRPEQYGGTETHPAVLRVVTFFKQTQVVSAGNRSHFIRHADAASQEVIALA